VCVCVCVCVCVSVCVCERASEREVSLYVLLSNNARNTGVCVS
jgi:hypothetical protein